MLTKRIIACLDVKDGRTVKGVKFEELIDAGDSVDLGFRYSEEGIDELVFLDITATIEDRSTFVDLVQRVATRIQIPFTVGGGIKKISDVEKLLRAGADKISLNSAAIDNPSLLNEVAREFGSQCLVVAIDSKKVDGEDRVFKHGGRTLTSLHTSSWAKEATNLGAGEILLTSIDFDGSKSGFDCNLIRSISESVSVPVVASGGAGCKEDFLNVFKYGKADAALAASIFHFDILPVTELKEYLTQNDVSIRPIGNKL